MRTLAKNKQEMYYSLQGEEITIYQKDEAGNIIYYTDKEGNTYPLKTGEIRVEYSKPILFRANISNKLTEAKWADYGVDNSTKYLQIVTDKNELPLVEGSLIWKQAKVVYQDDEMLIVDGKSADYVVKGIATEGLYEDLYLLQKIVK